MIRAVDNYPISVLFDIEGNFVYQVPRYQREYTWVKSHWDRLFDDLLENDLGYFLGSIICINNVGDTIAVQELEVVDGQQRLTTISLLFAAIFDALGKLPAESDVELIVSRSNIQRKLVLKNSNDRLRTLPQTQNNNQDDYRGVMSEIGVISKSDYPPYAGNRKIVRAFRHFQNRIAEIMVDESNNRSVLMAYIDKLNSASLVKIEVGSHADAYILFESLNDRGVPLTAVDLIKNKLLARIDRDEPMKVDYYYDQWKNLLKDLGDKDAIHERFFRHYYNAFRDNLKSIVNVKMASRSNLIAIYESLINHNAQECLTGAAAAGKIYSFIISPGNDENLRDLVEPLRDLDRIQGAPSYVLLLNLFARRKELSLLPSHLKDIVTILVKFFVRRNLTDSPPTNEVTRIPMRILEKLEGLEGEDIVSTIKRELASVSSPDAEFLRRLNGDIYEENEGVARFILISLAQDAMTKETYTDLWERNNNQWVWSIEHIFPQGEKIPDKWVQMMANGDAELAKQYREEYVHKLGNLTLTGYNSSLGTKIFEDKRDRKNDSGRFVGYKNGFDLNEELKDADGWSVGQITQRGSRLVERAMEIFRIEDPIE